MDVLCGLFDTLKDVGEFLGRSEEKCQELSKLMNTVVTLRQCVKLFVDRLEPPERERAYESNPVFCHLLCQMQKCQAVIDKNWARGEAAAVGGNGSAAGRIAEEGRGLASSAMAKLKSGLARGSRTFHEGLEVLGGKAGSCSGLLFLPEDELVIIRQASQELERLVPLLSLAIQVYSQYPQRGQKRALTDEDSCDLSNVPALRLCLVSDHEKARTGGPLPILTPQKMRLRSSASNSSLENGVVEEGAIFTRVVFGRQELKDVPDAITLTPKNSEKPVPLARFVSRDMFVLDIPLKQVKTPCADFLLADTLPRVCEVDDEATQQLCNDPGIHTSAATSIASITGLSHGGVHLRQAGEARWRWKAKGSKQQVSFGDTVAILLESPPGSSLPGAPRDLEGKDTTCLLGIELKAPL